MRAIPKLADVIISNLNYRSKIVCKNRHMELKRGTTVGNFLSCCMIKIKTTR